MVFGPHKYWDRNIFNKKETTNLKGSGHNYLSILKY